LYFYNLNTSGSCGSCCSEVFAHQHSHFPTTVGDAWFHRELRCMPPGYCSDAARP
jgi:hypothetical protein